MLKIILALIVLAMSISANAATVITDTVTVDGTEWAQPDLFINLSWNDINTVCPGGECINGGVLNGKDMTGWKWASVDDVNGLFNFYIGAPELGPGEDHYVQLNSLWAPAIFANGWRSTHSWWAGNLISGNHADLSNSCTMPYCACRGMLQESLESGVVDWVDTGFVGCSLSVEFGSNTIGAWFYRPSAVPAANINIVAIESGGDVVITASGSIDLTGLTLTGNPTLTSAISPNTGELWLGNGQGTVYTGFSPAPVPFGSGSQTSGTALSPSLFGIIGGDLLVPNGYVSNSQLGPFSDIWFGENFASLGMDVGSYLYTLTNGQEVSLEISADADDDGVADYVDNCTLVPNPTQCDGDGDNYGNHCDADFNNDLITNGLDIGPLKAGFGSADAVLDLNCDGIVNGLDIGPLKAMFGTAPGPSGLVP